MSAKNAFYAQSGGVTAVINATACGVIETIQSSTNIGSIYAGLNGIMGALNEELIDIQQELPDHLHRLRYTPGGALGSCRYKLQSPTENNREYQRLIDVFSAHNIGYFFYNGGGDSQDTSFKLAQFSKSVDYPLQCIGIPKTVDNDLAITDNSPGFGSVAKYVAIATREAGLDTASMCKTSTKVFILEVMGRHTGWIAASAGLAQEKDGQPPHMIIFPEVPFNQTNFLSQVNQHIEKWGYCVIVASEGARDQNNQLLAKQESTDAFGHAQLGGVAPKLAHLIQSQLKLKCHWAVADYLQRSAGHIVSATDIEQAYAIGKAAVEYALEGKTGIMPIIVRDSDSPYRWHIDAAPLNEIANIEQGLPASFIDADGYSITETARKYLLPLIQGESYPPYQNGLPQYSQLSKIMVSKKLPEFKL